MFGWFDLAWPWIGLGAAVVLVALLATPWLRSDRSVPRRHDPRWIGSLAIVTYLVHQVEEYGIAANGVPHAFPDELCALMGESAYPACTIPPAFYLAVNISLVWVAAPLAAILAPRIPALALVLWGVIAVNAVVHIVPAVLQVRYDAGLLTAVVLFVPLSIWVLGTMTGRQGPLRRGALAPVLGAGVLMHAVLAGSVLLFLHAGLPAWTMIALQPLGIAAGYGLVALTTRSEVKQRAA